MTEEKLRQINDERYSEYFEDIVNYLKEYVGRGFGFFDGADLDFVFDFNKIEGLMIYGCYMGSLEDGVYPWRKNYRLYILFIPEIS